jgi:hypothetical protein
LPVRPIRAKRAIPRCHGHRGCAEPRRPPQFPSNHNVASHALKLFQAVKKIAAPGSDHHMQPRGDFGPHQLNTATLGVTPPSSKLLNSSTRLAPRRSPKPPSRRRLQSISVRSYSSRTEHRAQKPLPTLANLASPAPRRVPSARNATDYLPRAA